MESGRLELGLGRNWRQFWLLVLVNAFVGAMVGLERTVLPLLAETEFGVASRSAMLSFVATFGAVKALTNLVAGRLGDLYGRRRVLLAGWLFGVPVPLLLIWAPSWGWVVAANVLLGANQGLAWSATVIMKVDLVGPRRRGLAMGLNEFAGYLAVAVAALATGWVAEAYGLRPEPFYLGIAFVALGLALSALAVRETRGHALLEAGMREHEAGGGLAPGGEGVFARVSWRDPALASASHAGLATNLKDGVAWGLFPVLFAAGGLDLGQVGLLVFLYPAAWGALQLVTGPLSDAWGRRPLIGGGLVLQGAALAWIAFGEGLGQWAAGSVLLGAGTAMVDPTLLAAVGDVAHPAWRSTAVGVYRFWRDGGYVAGALLAGVLADLFDVRTAVAGAGAVVLAAALLVAARMPETRAAGASAPAAGGG